MDKINYTLKEACEAANVSMPTLRKWRHMPGFPAIQLGKRRTLIPIDLFKKWLEEQAVGDAY